METAFRSSKTVHLELRPIHVRLATRTRGHVFVVMMAYRIIRELAVRWQDLDMTVEEGINELSTLCPNVPKDAPSLPVAYSSDIYVDKIRGRIIPHASSP